MKPLYQELMRLCANEQGRKSVQTAAIETAPEQFRKEMCKATRQYILPGIPEGRARLRDCFWFSFSVKFVWETAWSENEEKKTKAAEWLRLKRETAEKYGRDWPPKPIYQGAFTSPQPRTGKDGDTGYMPKNN